MVLRKVQVGNLRVSKTLVLPNTQHVYILKQTDKDWLPSGIQCHILVLVLVKQFIQKTKYPSPADAHTTITACAQCGKEGGNLNTCNKCNMVKYCNAACKKKHRSKHKKACERRVAELHDEALFKEHPPREDFLSAFFPYQLLQAKQLSTHFVVNSYVVVVFMP